MEQERIHRRLLELGIELRTAQALVGADAGAARLACVHTRREEIVPCDASCS